MSSLDEKIIVSFEARSIKQGRHHWISTQVSDADVRQKLSVADVLLVPWLDKREGVPVSFPDKTQEFFAYLREAGKVSVEICVDPEKFQVLSFHADEHRLPTVYIKAALLTVVLNLFSSWLYDELKAKPDDIANVKIIVESAPYKDCLSFEYRGSVAGVKDKMLDLAKLCSGSEHDNASKKADVGP